MGDLVITDSVCGIHDCSFTLKKTWNDRINRKVIEYADGMIESSRFYIAMRKADPKKVWTNHANGKKAEFFAEWWLRKKRGFPKGNIDLRIYKKDEKSWKPDLPYADKDDSFPNVHVKSCDLDGVALANDCSWIFENGKDRIYSDPEMQNDLVCLVYIYNTVVSDFTIKAIFPWTVIRPLLRLPVLEKHKEGKRAVYFKDLLEIDK